MAEFYGGDEGEHWSGTNDADIANGNGGEDYLTMKGGDDIADGGTGNDLLYGGGGHDTLNGGIGADDIFCGTGNDTVDAGAGDDRIYGGKGDDLIDTGSESDVAFGGDGNDIFYGGHGDDVLDGGDGRDWLRGDVGADRLTGGLDKDLFIFADGTSVLGAEDLINDLENIDRIDLRAIDANLNKDGDQKFHIVDALTGKEGQLVLTYDAAHQRTVIEGDNTGDGVADLVIWVAQDHTDYSNFMY